jgi:hypothetical protein
MDGKQLISISLLIGRVITVTLLIQVARKQYRTLDTKSFPELHRLRVWLFTGTMIALFGNFIPILIDSYGVFNRGSFGLLLWYVYSNNITAILAAIAILGSIRLSERTKLKTDAVAKNRK